MILERLSGGDARFVNDKIIEFNKSKVPFTQSEAFVTIGYGLKSEKNELLGGIIALLYCWRCLYIDVLWVSQEHQGKGLGTRLLSEVEREAKTRGCSLAHLDTFDFQAKGFYMKHGYEIFGELDNCPPGHKRLFLKKAI